MDYGAVLTPHAGDPAGRRRAIGHQRVYAIVERQRQIPPLVKLKLPGFL